MLSPFYRTSGFTPNPIPAAIRRSQRVPLIEAELKKAHKELQAAKLDLESSNLQTRANAIAAVKGIYNTLIPKLEKQLSDLNCQMENEAKSEQRRLARQQASAMQMATA